MILKRLQLTNVRAFRQAEFEFQPGMNLLVGINGVGKSTVLDAIRISLSRTLLISRPLKFEFEDITVGQEFLTSDVAFTLGDLSFSHVTRAVLKLPSGRHKQEGNLIYQREQVQNLSTLIASVQYLRQQNTETENNLEDQEREMIGFALEKAETFKKDLKFQKLHTLAVFFSPLRSALNYLPKKKTTNSPFA